MLSCYCRSAFFLVAIALFLTLVAPARAQRIFRLAIGGVTSRIDGIQGDTATSQNGAAALTLSVDLWKTQKQDVTLLGYYDAASSIFTGFYAGYGVAGRWQLTNRPEGYFYAGTGLAIYDLGMTNNTTLGARLSLGFQTSGTVFTELVFTPIAADRYTPGLGVMLGFRL